MTPPSLHRAAAQRECVLVGLAEQESDIMKQEMLINVVAAGGMPDRDR